MAGSGAEREANVDSPSSLSAWGQTAIGGGVDGAVATRQAWPARRSRQVGMPRRVSQMETRTLNASWATRHTPVDAG